MVLRATNRLLRSKPIIRKFRAGEANIHVHLVRERSGTALAGCLKSLELVQSLIQTSVCTENLNADVMVMKSSEQGV
jgi:hypothetical protein